MKAIIIDDERLARLELKKMLNNYSEITLIYEAKNGKEGKELIEKINPEIIFLDIQMPKISGFQLLESLKIVQHVVFTTAYDEYAIKAFEYGALDYLLKPIRQERFSQCITKLLQQRTDNGVPTNNIVEYPKEQSPFDRIFVKDGENCFFVKLQDIRFFQSEGNYVQIFFEDKKPMIHRSLSDIEKKLNPLDFFRANRKQIINLNWIENIEVWFNGSFRITLKTGEIVEVSRRQSLKFRDMMSL